MDHIAPHVVGLTDPRAADPDLAGGKGANLATLAGAGVPVPDGFIVATPAYRDFVREHRLDLVIEREMAQLGDRPADVDAASDRLRQAFEAAEIPAELRDAITAAHASLGEGPVAVRSSATAEDLPEASFAGQQETMLNVVGAADLCDAVRRCWSSLWTARAIAYRRHHDIGHDRIAVAVVVQRMVPADVAGVLFTADPVTGRRDHTVIEASAGLGEAVVSGRVTPDRWIVDSRTRAVVSGPDRSAALTAGQVDALVRFGDRAAELFGSPQDIEWAIAEARCWLLQSRPITSLFPLPPARPGLRVYLPAMLVVQGIAEPMTPAGNAFFRLLAARWIGYLLGQPRRDDVTPPPWLPIVAARIFAEVTPIVQRPRLANRLASTLRAKDPAAGAALREWLAHNAGRLPRPAGAGITPAMLGWLARALVDVVVFLAAPVRSRDRLVAAANDRLTRLTRQADALSSPRHQVDFVERTLVAGTFDVIVEQLPAVYAEELAKLAATRLTERWLGSAAPMEPVWRWLPHDPTIAMGAELARIAGIYAEPSPATPEVVEFLARYGHRAPDREIDLGLPRLTDDPTYVVELVHGYQRSGEPGHAHTQFETGAGEAQEAVDEIVAQVRRTKGPVRALILRFLLDRFRRLGGLRERPKFDMVRAIALGRRTLRRTGAALASDGVLDHADDVFFLDTADLRAMLSGADRNLRSLAAANRHEYQRELGRRTVPRLLVSDGEAVYGPAPDTTAGGGGVLVGTAVSPGLHEGVVRVLDSPVGADLRPGEILVAASTDPGWTPLFLLAGALVMEVGGVVSHGAVVAREYGIPAVADIAGATTRLRSGQRIRVDGGSGTVMLLDADGGGTIRRDYVPLPAAASLAGSEVISSMIEWMNRILSSTAGGSTKG
jgi:phosphohistidine swiveling domain-containing protein